MKELRFFASKVNLCILLLFLQSYARCEDFILNIEPFWNIQHNNNKYFFEVNIINNMLIDKMIDKKSIELVLQSTCDKKVYAIKMYPKVQGYITDIFNWRVNLPRDSCVNPLYNLIVSYKSKIDYKILQSKSYNFYIGEFKYEVQRGLEIDKTPLRAF